MAFKLKSKAVINGKLKDKYGDRADKENIIQDIPQISFPLEWENPPKGTKSYAIVFMDYDNSESEGFPFVHWLVCNLPAKTRRLPEDCSRNGGAFTQGTNSWSIPFGPYKNISKELTLRFGGPAPGPVEHEYETTIYALDIEADLDAGFYYHELRKEMRGHILAEAALYALY